MEEDDDHHSNTSIPPPIESWEDERTTKSEHRFHESVLVPLACSFRPRARTQTEETTLAQYSKRLISRTLSGIKASGQSLSKIVLPPIEKVSTTMEKAAYSMTEDNPFEEDDHDNASSTAQSSVSSISLDSARRLAATTSEHQPTEGAERTLQSRPPPAEIRIRVPASLELSECGNHTVEDWQSAWVQGGTPKSALKEEDEVPELRPRRGLPPRTSPHGRPPLATRSRTVGSERPRLSADKALPVSPSLSRVHTDTTVTSITTHTLRRPTPHNEALLYGRPKRSVTTGATVFSFGSRVGESSVSSPVKLSPQKSPAKPPVWKNLTAPVKRWTASPPQLCRSQTGCMA